MCFGLSGQPLLDGSKAGGAGRGAAWLRLSGVEASESGSIAALVLRLRSRLKKQLMHRRKMRIKRQNRSTHSAGIRTNRAFQLNLRASSSSSGTVKPSSASPLPILGQPARISACSPNVMA